MDIQTIVVTAVGTLIAQHSVQWWNRRHVQIEKEVKNAAISRESERFQKRIIELEAKTTDLEKEIKDRFGRAALTAKYRVDEHTGTLEPLNDGGNICPNCFHSEPIREVSVVRQNDQYFCPVCNKCFVDFDMRKKQDDANFIANYGNLNK